MFPHLLVCVVAAHCASQRSHLHNSRGSEVGLCEVCGALGDANHAYTQMSHNVMCMYMSTCVSTPACLCALVCTWVSGLQYNLHAIRTIYNTVYNARGDRQ